MSNLQRTHKQLFSKFSLINKTNSVHFWTFDVEKAPTMRSTSILRKGSHHRCFLVNFTKFFRTNPDGWFCILILILAQKMKFSIKDFFSKCDQIRRKLKIWPHLLKKSLIENFIFYAVNHDKQKYFIQTLSF